MLINQILLEFKDVSLEDYKIENIKADMIKIMENAGIEVEYVLFDYDTF